MRRASLAVGFALFVSANAPAQVFGPSGPELRVNTYTTGPQGGGSVAVDQVGNFIVVWDGEGPDGSFEVYAQRFSFANAVGQQFRVNTYTTMNQHAARVAANGLGTGAVVWVSDGEDLDTAGIYGQRLQLRLPIGGAFRVNTTTTGYQSYMNVASDGGGNFVVVWATGNGGQNINVWAQRFASNGVAQGGEFRVNTFTTGDQGRPAVARAPSGEFVVVWQSEGQIPTANAIGIYGQRYAAAGAPLGIEFLINEMSTAAVNPAVSVDAGGKFVVVWETYTGAGRKDIFARRYAATGAPLVPEFIVNTATVDYQFDALVSAQSNNADLTGTFVVAWNSGSLYGGEASVFAQRYLGDGTKVGGPFRVNSVTTGFPSLGGIDHDLSGNFVITWNAGTGGNSDVFVRKYCQSLAGDADGDNAINVGDIFYLINALFAGGPAPVKNTDANGDGVVNVNDVFYLINYLFAGGPPPSCPINVA
jgi:hypothetical protein